eukprot:SAG11_NODE_495_length_8943_cov_274.008028_9_plen_59_part_00
MSDGGRVLGQRQNALTPPPKSALNIAVRGAGTFLVTGRTGLGFGSPPALAARFGRRTW